VRRLTIGFTITAFVLMAAVPAAAGYVVYSNDFEGTGPLGPEWSAGVTTDITPGTVAHPADKFLGQFGNQTVTLTLDNLYPDHTEVTLSYDLYIIRSWDGNFDQDARGPDYLANAEGIVPQGPGDWQWITTFSNWGPTGPRQAFPGEVPTGDYQARTGASENDTLGFLFDDGNGPFVQDAVYRFVDVPIPHTGDTLILSIGADHLQALDDESWGIDNMKVEIDAIPEPSTLALLLIAGLTLLCSLRRRAK